jgi:hypothetical protein
LLESIVPFFFSKLEDKEVARKTLKQSSIEEELKVF